MKEIVRQPRFDEACEKYFGTLDLDQTILKAFLWTLLRNPQCSTNIRDTWWARCINDKQNKRVLHLYYRIDGEVIILEDLI
jgi:hypothetical protein